MSWYNLPPKVDYRELLARYLTQKGHYNLKDNRVKHTAFMPKDDNLQISVFRIDGLLDSEVWQIGEDVVKISGRHLHGRADIVVLLVEECGLLVNADDSPPRHANIIGWPEERSKRLELAQELAASATLKIRT